MIHKDLELHEAQVSSLKDMADDIPECTTATSDLSSRYDKLCSETHRLLDELEDQVAVHQKYKQAYRGCMDGIVSTRHSLQNLIDTSGSQADIRNKLAQLKVRLAILENMFVSFPRTQSIV